ncbi:thiamine pyrophosphate-binding protein [Microvirga flavescens]|uniref:thiamine pyrophosphate-binding protein n=1 Tax=Microvirga flavescens TaxID=2249811 RepID=UPI0018E0A458|nr:thiamine pyrophosphate-binding protein [Microvirga flavescens]
MTSSLLEHGQSNVDVEAANALPAQLTDTLKHSNSLTVAEYFVKTLESEHVSAVFGVPGGNIAAFQQALRAHGSIKFIISSHEAGAAFMADGYARATGGLGVCLVTAGPGLTNALTGIASAHLDQVPLLAISGQVPTTRFGMGAIQESTTLNGVDTVGLMKHASAASIPVSDAESFPGVVDQALRKAFGLRGAVHLSIPANVARQSTGTGDYSRSSPRAKMPSAGPGDVEAAIKLISQAKRPLIFIGAGARDALVQHGEEFNAFVAASKIPVASSVRGKGLFPEDHPLALGVMGMAANQRAEAYLRDGVDVMLVLGSKLGDWASRSFHRDFNAVGTVIQVDLDLSAMGRFLPVDLPVVGDIGTFVSDLCTQRAAFDTPSRDDLQDWLAQHPHLEPAPKSANNGLHPHQVMLELNACLQPDMDLYIDMGNVTGWSAHSLTITPPTRIFYPTGLSSMGWTCGAVIGGKIGRPERQAIAVTGDGSFLMNGTELLVASRHKAGTVTLVLNDNFLGMVNHGERSQAGQGHYPLDDQFFCLGNPDLVRFAEALGARTHIVRLPGDLARALPIAITQAAKEQRPQVVIIKVDHEVPPPYGERFTAVAGDAH